MAIIVTRKKVIAAVCLGTALLLLLVIFGKNLLFQEKRPELYEETTETALRDSGTEREQQKLGEEDLQEKLTPVPAAKELESGSGDEFFVEYRLERDRIRSQQVQLLREVVDNPNSVAETRQEAQNRILEITQRMEQELQLENLIVAKGYKDAVVFIEPDSVTVIVHEKNLTQTDAAKIADLVSRYTDHKLEDIVIIPKG
ncbi:SpoIIIAH-like family protein [Calderihabitans maritimus]|uniref:Stage III sporulation protein AH n=1 Tax=Calderihabitans maritimus TaxID=1246530 RepID=A0A1Z5HXC6_9FIRM|nr:SpoIIIAH-like family protein [Calderihabitans maritimus]GAW94164.1 hypothetical protein Moth_1529 [Calderihabitans maritimus]